MSDDLSKTTIRRLEQYRDRWSSYDAQTGLVEISDKLSVEQLKEFELFADFDDRFLEAQEIKRRAEIGSAMITRRCMSGSKRVLEAPPLKARVISKESIEVGIEDATV